MKRSTKSEWRDNDLDILIEPERYELFEVARRFRIGRRSLLKSLGGGIVVLLVLDSAPAQDFGKGGRRRGGGGERPRDIGAWLHIGEDGSITAFTGKAEVGQNIRTSLSQAVADELRVPLNSVKIVMGDTDRTPFDMGTFGSRTTPDMARQLRRVAAAARERLIDLAAEDWRIQRSALTLSGGSITNPKTNEAVSFGTLTKGRKLTEIVADDTATTPPASWEVGGKSAPKVDGRDFVTGKHRYASDVQRPGLGHGKILRPSSYGATLKSFDAKAAEALTNVVVVRDGDFVGVVASTEHEANRALKAIKAEWLPSNDAQPSNRELFTILRPPVAKDAPRRRAESGSPGEQHLEQTYHVAYIAHAPLEPRAAVAEWDSGKLTVWTGTQRPFGVRGELARVLGVPEKNVRVQVPDTGAGYGGKHTGEAAVEAARLARAAGRPVKVVWTRAEEFTWAYFRPAGVIEIASSVRPDGRITAWEFDNYNSGGSAVRSPYDVPNQRSEYHPSHSPLRQGSYRSLAATANHFARETHMDELAHLVGMDPLEFRRKNLRDPRLRAVLEAATKAFGWDRKVAPGHGGGLALGTDKGSYLATCAEVAVDRESGRVQVVRAVSAFDCGAVVNPDHLKNQIEGAMVMGLGGALFEAIEFDKGVILNSRFSRYRVPRFSDAPAIEVVLIDRKDQPSAGAGETPIVGIAPAIGNAIFAATGVRLRSLPMAPQGVNVS
jgi:isoquinoline 1-oxidoreductase